MRTGPYAGRDGLYHEAAFYSSDEEFVAIALPFLLDGVAAGEPSLVACGAGNEKLLRAALPDDSPVVFRTWGSHYAQPASTIKAYREFLAQYVADGAAQVRIIGEVPLPCTGSPWESWARYEAAVNTAYDDFPMWGLCAYDTRLTPRHVIDDASASHPHLADRGGRAANPGYRADHPALTRAGARTDVLEATPPLLDLLDPSPAQARDAVRAAAARTGLTPAEVDDMLIAASEAVSNGHVHGVAPVRARFWAAHDRVVVAVSDRGPGPADPMAGMVPARESLSAGVGLWLSHQICAYVTLDRAPDGYTLHLVVGRPELG